MSKLSTRSKPAARAIAKAPATPADGPESRVAIGRREARSSLAAPPSDCTMRSGPQPRSASPAESRRRYRDITGPM